MPKIKVLRNILVITIITIISIEHSYALITRASEFIIHEDKICNIQSKTENTETHSVHECSVKCMTGADCVGFTHQDGRCSFVSDVQDLSMSAQTGAKCVINESGLIFSGNYLVFNI